ncbi:MAG: glycoside hydrolase family 97 protein [Flavisolibacter sp.]
MKNKVLLILSVFTHSLVYAQKQNAASLASPDQKIVVTLQLSPELKWSVRHGQTNVILPSSISMLLLNGEVLGKNVSVQKITASSVHDSFPTPIYKKAMVKDEFNQLVVQYKGNYSVIFRAYNDGVAYRFVTSRKDSFVVKSEQADFVFDKDAAGFFPYAHDFRVKADPFATSFESLYEELPLSKFTKDTLAFLPILMQLDDGKKAVITESSLENYPGMYLTSRGGNQLTSVFAPYPLEEKPGGYRDINSVVSKRADYISRLAGTGSFPWRVIAISTADRELANSDLVHKLSSPSRLKDISWIKPGKVAWDWWNNWNISGVDFAAGINTQTYKYYIDFASENHLEYIIMDEGWSDDNDLTKIVPAINLQQIIDYGKQKNVGVILWATWKSVYQQMNELFPLYASMGIKGFKIDFLDRDDQKMVASTFEIAKKAAENKLIVDYHGMFKPSGLLRTYPNVLNCEGVRGMENVKWAPNDDVPRYDVSIPFIRMLAGAMDYTPGAMRNATKQSFRPINSNPMSQGTRCHQLAMYTVFEAPLQMLSDNPTSYRKEQECTDFISLIPTTFDRTIALDGTVGEYIVMAREKNEVWYVGVLNNWTARDVSIDFSFLGEGVYSAQIFRDGINADRQASDYKKEERDLRSENVLKVHLAPGGGWTAILSNKK